MEGLKLSILVLLSWLLIYLIYISHISNLAKITLSLVLLYVIGEYLVKKLNLDKELVFILWKNKNYVFILKKLSLKLKGLFLNLVDSAIFLAFGLLAFKIITWRSLKEKIVLALIGYTILTGIVLIYPYAVSLLAITLGISTSSSASSSILPYLIYIVGLAPIAFLALILSSFSILQTLFFYFQGKASLPTQATTILLPGINIPFLEGLIALAIILVIHEFSHGIVSFIENVRVKSMGIVTFGTIPIGAFVEPDEERLLKSPKKSIIRIVIAGISSNLLAAIFFFALFLLFLNLTMDYSVESCLVITKTKVLHALSCENGEVILFDNSKIEIPEDAVIKKVSKQSFLRYYPFPILQFIYNTLLLLSSLNLVVAIINLLPIPFFDGDLIFSKVLPEKAHEIVRIASLIALIISFLPGLL